jgi:hypothetical protein
VDEHNMSVHKEKKAAHKSFFSNKRLSTKKKVEEHIISVHDEKSTLIVTKLRYG